MALLWHCLMTARASANRPIDEPSQLAHLAEEDRPAVVARVLDHMATPRRGLPVFDYKTRHFLHPRLA